VPAIQVWTWSTAALAAEAADEAPRASMMAAPRLATVGMNSSASHFSSLTTSAAFRPATSAWKMSGYWVAEWLPQMVRRRISLTGVPVFFDSWVSARLWSRRVMAVNRSAGTSGAAAWAISALVLAGLPTTRTRTSSAAWSLMAWPCGLKMPPLAASRSPRSMPLPRGRAPTSSAMLVPSNAVAGSSVMSMPASSGNAQSSSSIAVPSAADSAGVISRRRSLTGTSGPSNCPEAMRKSSA
jgi:hypothetical protein